MLVVLRPSADALGEVTHVSVRTDGRWRRVGRLRGADFLDIMLVPGEHRVCLHQGSDSPAPRCSPLRLAVAEVRYLEWAVSAELSTPGSVRDGASTIGQTASSDLGRLTELQARTLLRGLTRGNFDPQWKRPPS